MWYKPSPPGGHSSPRFTVFREGVFLSFRLKGESNLNQDKGTGPRSEITLAALGEGNVGVLSGLVCKYEVVLSSLSLAQWGKSIGLLSRWYETDNGAVDSCPFRFPIPPYVSKCALYMNYSLHSGTARDGHKYACRARLPHRRTSLVRNYVTLAVGGTQRLCCVCTIYSS